MCKHPKETKLDQLERLFIAACRRPGEKWDNDRRIEAANDLTDFVGRVLPPDQFERLEDWCINATFDEIVNESHRRCKEFLSGRPVAPCDHDWQRVPGMGGLIDQCTKCGEERA